MKTKQTACPGGTLYTIRAGDTFYSLARRFNTTVDEITKANPAVDPTKLSIGQQICIPVPPVPGSCEGGTVYTIVAGDTLSALARKYNTTVDAIMKANPGLDPNALQIGRRICIPGPAAQPTCPNGTLHTIVAGDTLAALARRYNTTVQAITQANPGIVPERLRIGQQICIPGPAAQPACPGGTLHTIVAGDTLAALARRYNTTVQAITQANPGIDPERLRIGQRICIPGPAAQPTCPNGTLYTIVAGDTLAALARRYNTTVQAITQANPGIDPDRLRIGQQICIPAPSVPCSGGTIYTIAAGDTLYAIAGRYNTTVDAILRANPGLDPNALQIGRRICIPVAPTPGPCTGGTIYVIKAGDTLSAIAYANGITLDKLMAANPQITDPNRISVGQSICIPADPPGGMTVYAAPAAPYAQSPYTQSTMGQCPFVPFIHCPYHQYCSMMFRPY